MDGGISTLLRVRRPVPAWASSEAARGIDSRRIAELPQRAAFSNLFLVGAAFGGTDDGRESTRPALREYLSSVVLRWAYGR